ncbi:LamG-like jellyroll fold domain-containing protein [Planctomicrobium sp. SH664]|uniref:LamG-like jellyroll fold domain-containing protein n=1 Tax=Planctomicrobium sp. SH664 TaxID=3448125 RepID=UPI003F5B5463
MRDFPEYDEVRLLLEAVCEQTILPGEMQRLEQILMLRPEAEAFYIQYMNLNAELIQSLSSPVILVEQLLRGTVESEEDRSPAQEPRVKIQGGARFNPQLRRLTRVALLLILGVATGALWWRPSPPATRRPAVAVHTPAEAKSDKVTSSGPAAGSSRLPLDGPPAILTNELDAKWRTAPLRVGYPLPATQLYLESGLIQLRTMAGVTLVVEGPADLHFPHANELRLLAGRLWIDSPSTVSVLSVVTPLVTVEDHGNEFGVDVSEDGSLVEVHNVRAPLKLSPSNQTSSWMTQEGLVSGQGLRIFGATESMELFTTDGQGFSRAQSLLRYVPTSAQIRQKVWQADVERHKQDTSLLIHYTFEPEDPQARILTNAGFLSDHRLNGAIFGCRWGEGRWPGKRSLEYRDVSDRVHLVVPGEFDNLTLAAWVRVDQLKNRFNSLLMPDSWDECEPHWHISNLGGLELGVQGPERKELVHYDAKRAISTSQFGLWLHVAVTYDRDNGWVTHYLNGYPISEVPMTLDTKLRIGDAELGNWNTRSRVHSNPIRHFTGAIDEFMLFSRALPMAEIHELYRAGSSE